MVKKAAKTVSKDAVKHGAIDSKLLKNAVAALLDFESKKDTSSSSTLLLGSHAKPIFAQIQLKSELKDAVVRPVRIAIPNSFFSAGGEGHNICLFVRSEDKDAIETQLNNDPIEGIDKILSINDVKKLYAPHKEKKALLGQFTHFLCDVRIMNHLYNLLGKVFGSRNHLPVPIEFGSPSKLAKAVSVFKESTYMHLRGSNISIRFGHSRQKADDIVQNMSSGLDFAVQRLKHEWRDVASIHIKSADSAALPVYSALPSEELRFVQKELTKAADTGVATQGKATEVKAAEKKQKKLKSTDAATDANDSTKQSTNTSTAKERPKKAAKK